MKNYPTLKIFSIYLLVLILIIFISSCSSINKTINKIKNDPELYKAVERYVVVEKKACINDTITISKDSIIYKTRDSIIRDSIITPCPDFDKTLNSGIRIISKSGELKVVVPVNYNEKEIIKTITNNIRDKKQEDILRQERSEAIDLYDKASLKIISLKKEKKDLESQIKSLKRKQILIFSGIGILGLVLIVLKVKKFLPF